MSAVKVNSVKKTFKTEGSVVTALQQITFDVNKGELFGLIGPDGAGKTSLFRILVTVMLSDEGTATVDGFDVVRNYKEIRRRVGYMPGRFSLYQDLSVEENLSFFATLFNTSLQENYDLIKSIYQQIEPFKKRKARALSGGMKQKLALCCALIHRPSVLFLDEPTTGVDAVSRKEFWELLRDLQKHRITIIASTPYMDEACLCDRVALIQNGKMMEINSPKGITENFKKSLWAVRGENMYQLMQTLLANEAIDSCYPFGQYHHVTFTKATSDWQAAQELEKITDVLEAKKISASIEDCFMELMRQ